MTARISRAIKPGTKNKTGSWRSQRPVVDPKKCTRCGQCELFCPDNAIKVGKKSAVVNYDYCKGCAICATVCPKHAISMHPEK
ncbi:MAG: 4Fe-4S binding protein [Candidatus Micrarchaeota archaeon]